MVDIPVEEVVALCVTGVEPREVRRGEGAVGGAVRPRAVKHEGAGERVVLLTRHHAEVWNKYLISFSF